MAEPVSDNRSYVIVDTNVFQNFANTEIAEHILDHMKEAIDAGYSLSISEFTLFETIDGATTKKERERLEAIGSLKRFRVNKSTLFTAAHLGCLYQDDKHTISDVGDKIIAATALLTNSMIYTFNARDFPVPFFTIEAERVVRYKNNGVGSFLACHFIKPNTQLILEKYKYRMNTLKKK